MINPELRDHLETTMKGLPKEELIGWTLKALDELFAMMDQHAMEEGVRSMTGRRKTDRSDKNMGID